MSKLITIAIPTFNRASLLDQQLAWLAQSIKGFESECEIIISDNCSTDETPNVIKKWQPEFNNTLFQVKRNNENIGAVRNIASCIMAATSKYVWTISDDDKIFANTLAYVVSSLNENPNLGLLILNFSSSDFATGQLLTERCYAVENDEVCADGKVIFERCLEQDNGGVTLTTALVYRTDLAQRAIEKWESGLNNLAVQLYWTAFCASYGSVKISKDNYLECVGGNHHFIQIPQRLVTLTYADIPEVLVKLTEIGYSESLSRKMVISCFWQFNWRVLLGGLRRWPIISMKAVIAYVNSVYSCMVAHLVKRYFNPRKFRESTF